MSEDVPDAAGGVLAGFGPGRRVAGYLLEEQVGAGGMAVVFRAVDERLGRLVALKILAPGLAADRAFRQRFIRESRAAAAVDDPHIVPVYEAGEAGGILFIAMRLVPGRDARTLLCQEGPLPAGRVAAIISPVASALDAAHAAGLVHRDVKPANMLVDVRPDRPDHVYLSDFGLSKGALASAGLTGSGQFLGTPSYIAPEQIQGGAVDGRTDQYGLACAAFELLAGGPPFERDQPMAVVWAHLAEPPPPLCSRRPDLPGAADAVFARALAKAAQDRYRSCRDFAEALRAALGLAPYNSGPGRIQVAPHPVTEIAMPAGRLAGPVHDPQSPGLGSTEDLAAIAPGGAQLTVAAARRTDIGDLDPGSGDVSRGDVPAVAFSPDGAALAVGRTGGVFLCDPATGRVAEDLTAALAAAGTASLGVEAIAYSPDGALLAVGASDSGTRVWDLAGRRLATVLTDPGSAGTSTVAFSPDGSTLAVGDENGSISLRDVSTWQARNVLTSPGSGGVFSAAFSPDGSVLAVGDGNGSACLWSTSGGQLIATLARHGTGEVFSVAFTPDGSVLATGHEDGSLCLWDASNGSQLTILTRRGSGHAAVLTVAVSPHGLLAAGYAAAGLCLWEIGRRRPLATWARKEPGGVLAAAFSPDSQKLATGHSHGRAWIWDLATGHRIVVTTNAGPGRPGT